MARVEHIKFIEGVEQLTQYKEHPSVLKNTKLRTYPSNYVAFHIDKPRKTYKIEYMLTAGDVNDLALRYHAMFISQKLPYNQFEKMDWERNGIDIRKDSAETFRKKLKSVVILSDVVVENQQKYNEQTQTYDIIPTNVTKYYAVPYSIFRQQMFVRAEIKTPNQTV